MTRHHHSYQRTDRVREQILRELAELIRSGIKDPRLGFVTLTDAQITRDYSYADVYYTVLDDNQRQETQSVLDKASGFLRSELARRITLFRVPELHFIYDTSIEHGMHIDQLLHQVSQEKPVED
ncbi:MAG: 30S ribosome-binding factor RbfA [Neisseriaceae bacterium]|nr:30S ribosome-binding factor RbfA [Neisseriaceae bacterium]